MHRPIQPEGSPFGRFFSPGMLQAEGVIQSWMLSYQFNGKFSLWPTSLLIAVFFSMLE